MLPATECLLDVVVRVLPYWYDTIVPQLRGGLDVLVVAHGNSLRALMMHLETISADEIAEINIPTGAPRLYRFDRDLRVTSAEYLGDQAAIAAKAAAVAAQAGAGEPAEAEPSGSPVAQSRVAITTTVARHGQQKGVPRTPPQHPDVPSVLAEGPGEDREGR